MALFSYTALDTGGKQISGSVEADTVALAISQVREMGYFPTRVTEQRRTTTARAPAGKKKGGAFQITIKIPGLYGRIGSKQLTIFTRQLSTLIDAGLPLLRSLNVLGKQQKPGAMRDILERMAEDIEGGSTFSEALGKHPLAFSKLFVNMVKAGEAGGVLETVLDRLADFSEKQQALVRKVRSAMIYPIFIVIATTGILAFLVTKIIPTFAEMFKDMDSKLPPLTQFLLNFTDLVQQRWYVPLITVITIIFLYVVIYKTRQGKFYIDKLKLNIPIFGQLLRKITIARFSRTLGTLISSGVPILQSLNITKDTAGNEVLARAVTDVHNSIREGESIAAPLEASGVFPAMVTNMIDVGEETGALDTMLTKVADNYDDEVDTAVAGLTSVMEPVLIIMMGAIVGTIVIALFLPLIKIAQEISV